MLEVGSTVQVQNQTGPHARKWDLSGVVLESLGHDSYLVKMDGSGRITKRNRKFLRAIRPYKDILRDLGKGLGMRGEPVVGLPRSVGTQPKSNVVVTAVEPQGAADMSVNVEHPSVQGTMPQLTPANNVSCPQEAERNGAATPPEANTGAVQR